MDNQLDAVLAQVKRTVDANVSDRYPVHSPDAAKVYKSYGRMTPAEIAEDNRRRIARGEKQPEPKPAKEKSEKRKAPAVVGALAHKTVNAPDCVNSIMAARSVGGIYTNGVIESIDDDEPIVSVPFFGDAGAVIDGEQCKLGTVFTPYFLKIYFACLIIWSDQGRAPIGKFVLKNGMLDILRLIGAPKDKYTSSSGKILERYRDRDIKKLRETLEKMRSITIREFRDQAFDHGDALIDLRSASLDGKNLIMMHARLVSSSLQSSFFQLPRAAVHLPKEDIPYVIGINYMVRQMIVGNRLRNKSIRAPIDDWLVACGQDVATGRKKGTAAEYYATKSQEIIRVAQAIGAGDVTLSSDDGITNLQLDPTREVVRWYQPLIDIARHKTDR